MWHLYYKRNFVKGKSNIFSNLKDILAVQEYPLTLLLVLFQKNYDFLYSIYSIYMIAPANLRDRMSLHSYQ